MKTLKISDEAHAKLISVVGRLMAETGKMKTYSDAIETMLNKSVILSQRLLEDVECFIKDNSQLGYTTKEEFLDDAIRSRLTWLKGENECVEIPREQYDRKVEKLGEEKNERNNRSNISNPTRAR